MSATSIVVMTLILGFVWGGFLLIVATAVRAERAKQRPGGPSPERERGPS